MTRAITEAPPPPPPQEDPFYGWRYVERVRPDGRVEVVTLPLTLEDVLHPQEGDVIPENSVHEADRRYLSDIFHARLARLEDGLVLSDCLVDWGVTGLRNHSPDISAFSGLKVRPPEPIGIFRLRASGGRCLAVVELVSPHTRSTDVDHKPGQYHRAKVPLFIMVDQKKEGGPRRLRVFRWAPAAYVEENPETVLIPELGLRLGLKDNRVVCYDADTGEELGDYVQEQKAHEEAERARQDAEQQAREQTQARQAAEEQVREQAQARQAAEEQVREQTQARQAAEEQVREQAQARQAAEEQAREQAQARQAAEERAREQAQARQGAEEQAREQVLALQAAEQQAREQALARQAAEQRVRELEDRLRGLQGNDPPQ